MNELHRLFYKRTLSSVIIAMVIGAAINYPAHGQPQAKNQQLSLPLNLSINFNPPNDDVPKGTVGGATR